MESPELTTSLEETLTVFDSTEPRTTAEVAETLDIGRRATYARLERLAEAGEIATKSVGARGRVWWRPDSDRAADDRNEQDRYARMIDALDSPVYELDAAGRFVFVNDAFSDLVGYDREELLGEHVSIGMADDSVENIESQIRDHLANGHDGIIQDEFELSTEQGDRIPVDTRFALLRDNGRLTGTAGVIRELTERHEREHRLQRYRTTCHALADGMATLDAEYRFAMVNDTFCEMTGYDRAELLGAHVTLVMAEDVFEHIAALRESVLAGERELATHEYELLTASDGVIPVEARFGPLELPNGEIGATGIVRDISERKRLEDELDEHLDRITDAFYALDVDWRFTFINDQAKELFGISEDILGENFWDVYPHLVDTEMGEQFRAAMETQRARSFERYSEALDMWATINLYPSPTGLSVYMQDVSDRKAAEAALRERERRYRDLFTSMSEGYSLIERVATDPVDFRYVEVNPAFKELTDHDNLVGRTMREFDFSSLEDWIAEYDAILEGGEPARFERELHGGETVLECYAFPVGCSDVPQLGVIFTDITERIHRAAELDRRRRQQRHVADLAQFALDHYDLEELMHRAVEGLVDTLDHDAARVLELDDAREALVQQHGTGWNAETPAVIPIDDYAICERLADCGEVLIDEAMQKHDLAGGVCAVIGPADDPWGVLGSYASDPRDLSEEEVGYVQTVANIIGSAIARNERKFELERQHDELTALHNLNEAVSEITRAVVEQSTREEIEQTVCDALAATAAYEFAWVGEVNAQTEEFQPRAVAGDNGYTDEITVSVDPDDPRSDGPAGRAIREQEIQVSRNVFTDPSFAPWRDAAREYGFTAAASIPIVHENTIYGVLCVYADREAFDDAERSIVSQLGEVMGHAIAAAERKRALMSDELVELDLRVPDVFEPFGQDLSVPGQITLDHAIPTYGDEFLVYGTATDDAVDVLENLVALKPHWEDVEVVAEGDPAQIEVRSTAPPMFSAIADLGGYVASSVYSGSTLEVTVHLAPRVDTHRAMAAIEEQFASVELLSRKQITRERDALQRTKRQVTTDLTDRQRAILDAAYYAGYYRWPRDTSGKEVADSLGIAPATFSQHLRKAEQKIFDGLFPPLHE